MCMQGQMSFCCSSHLLGNDRVNSSSCNPFDCRPSRIISTMSGESSVNRSSRLTKLRVTPSASASSPADRYLPSSSKRFHRCARTSARISALSHRGFAGAHASPPSGAMMTLRPPRRFQVIGMRTVIVEPWRHARRLFGTGLLTSEGRALPPAAPTDRAGVSAVIAGALRRRRRADRGDAGRRALGRSSGYAAGDGTVDVGNRRPSPVRSPTRAVDRGIEALVRRLLSLIVSGMPTLANWAFLSIIRVLCGCCGDDCGCC